MISKIKAELKKFLEDISLDEPVEESFEAAPEQEAAPAEETIETNMAKVLQESEVKISLREVGGRVEQINPDGTLAELEDGDYELNTGFKFSLKEGLISAILGENGEVIEEAKEEEKKEEAFSITEAEVLEFRSEIASLKEQITALKTELEGVKASADQNASKTEMEAFSKQVSDLAESIKLIASIPAEFSKTNKHPKVVDAYEQKMEALASIWSRRN